MEFVAGLIDRHFRSANGELYVGQLPVGQLAAEYGTPVFVYDRSVIDRKVALLRETLPARFAISYSVKANPNPAVVRHFIGRGCGLEIASAGEYELALNAGCPTGHVVYAGPGKTEAELELVLAKGIGEIHVESMLEIRRIAAISRRLGVRANVAIRVNPTEEVQGGAMRMGGKPAPFGIDEESLEDAVGQILENPSIEFRGVHLFTGTQILDHDVLIGQYRKGLRIAKRIVERYHRPIHTLDFGGGLGVPYFPHERELDMLALRQGLTALMQEIEGDPSFSGVQMMVEPGRYLVAESGVYVARIIDIKVSRGKKYLILDGGMNHHLAASGNLGQTIKRNYPIAVVTRLSDGDREVVDLVGPLCTPLDTLGRSVELPRAEVGDLVGVLQSGAYARSASPLGFLSHPAPPEVWVDGRQSRLIRPRGSITQ
jgi:diaminopimelate decarboxylase